MRITSVERLLGVLGYLPLVCLLIVRLKRDSIFVQFHARQGSVLFVLWLIAVLLVLIVIWVLQPVGLLSNILFGIAAALTLVYIVMVVFTVLFKVAFGERYRMPVVADVALMLKL